MILATGVDVDRILELVAEQAGEWDLAGLIPGEVVSELAGLGLLAPQIPQKYGGLGLTSLAAGELTARVGSLCSSVRSLMTSVGMAAWIVERLGDEAQRADLLGRFAHGETAAVAMTEVDAGSDLGGLRTTIVRDDTTVTVDGVKTWVTGAHYAQWIVVFGRSGTGGAAVVVPTDAPGVQVQRIADPLGCRAAGHSEVRLDRVELPVRQLLGGAGMPLALLATSALTYGRLSVGWGCVGILRACLGAAARHARTRRTFGSAIAEHQLVRRHLAELYLGERTATLACEEASRCWDGGRPEQARAAVLAKHVAATRAAEGAAAAVQVLASAGVRDGHVAARAYRDAKLMELIEGSNELSQLMLADEALAAWS